MEHWKVLTWYCKERSSKESNFFQVLLYPIKILSSFYNSCFKYFLYYLGFVSDLAKHLLIKEIKSQPYHPQPQGKIERSHSTWQRKLEYDTLHNDGQK